MLEKIKHEKNIVNKMINIYCNGKKHKDKNYNNLCINCNNLLEYSEKRVEKCPFLKKKTFCSLCPVQCYKKEMQNKIKKVMRFSGPRLLLHHPVLTIKHFILNMKEKQKLQKENSS